MSPTPGPWRVVQQPGELCVEIGFSGTAVYVESAARAKGKVVAFLRDAHHMPPEEVLPNARLIAAAPALLDALQDMLAGWRYIREVHGDLPGVGWDRAQAKAEAALAQAEGKEPSA